METVKTRDAKSIWVLAILVIGFLGCFIALGPDMGGDSKQYIDMHIHREPIYPLFLALLRCIFGSYWITAMGILQNIFVAFGIWYFAEYVGNKFLLTFWQKLIVIGLGLMPHIVTPLASQLGLILGNAVLTEGISMTMFILFVVACSEILTQTDTRKVRQSVVVAIVWALVLSLTRGQMMCNLLVWMVVVTIRLFRANNHLRKKVLQFCIVIIVIGSAFVFRSLCVKSYNYAVHGYFINNTNGTVHMLTNVLYASDREDGNNIEDAAVRDMFYQIYDMADKQKANYKYAGKTWVDKVEHIEMWHNTINFDMVEATMRQYFRENVSEDYIIQDLCSDEMAGQIIAGILPKCFTTWFGNYLLLACYGLIRSIAVVHPLINGMVAVLYGSAVFMIIWGIKLNRKENEKVKNAVWFMGLSILIILANAFSVSLIIMPISRYMIYGFPVFYTALGVLTLELARNKKAEKKKRRT